MGPESKFLKSKKNRVVENAGLRLLLLDPRFQVPNLATKQAIVEELPGSGEWGIQSFDAVMGPEALPPLTAATVAGYLPILTLVEMKTTQKPIRNAALNGFFFGATEREYAMARAIGDHYRFAFIVLSRDNDYGCEFAVLLTLHQVEERTRAKRVQYQVNFRTDMTAEYEDETPILLGNHLEV